MGQKRSDPVKNIRPFVSSFHISRTTPTTGAPAATLRYRELTAEFERVYGGRPELFARAPGAFFE